MRINRIRCCVISHPLPAPLCPTWMPGRTFAHTACTLVEITTDEDLAALDAVPRPGLGFNLGRKTIRAGTVRTRESDGSL
jgi:hypothetical protein